LWKRQAGRTACCRQHCSNRSRSCVIRTRKVIERKRRRQARDANWEFGSAD
jgi:hypothetical protein